jgi:hypothetical protein
MCPGCIERKALKSLKEGNEPIDAAKARPCIESDASLVFW